MEIGDPDLPVKVNVEFLDKDQIKFLILDVVLKRFMLFMFLMKLLLFYYYYFYFYPLLIFEIAGYIGIKLLNRNLVWACIIINCQEHITINIFYLNFGIPLKNYVGSFVIVSVIWVLYIFFMVFYVNKAKKFSEESIRNMKEAIKECKLYIQY